MYTMFNQCIRIIQKSNENNNWNLIVTYRLLKHSVILMFDDNHKDQCFDMNHDNVCAVVVAAAFCPHCCCHCHYFFVNVKSTKSMVLDLVNFYRRYFRRSHFAYCSSFNFKIKQKQTETKEHAKTNFFFAILWCENTAMILAWWTIFHSTVISIFIICHRFRDLLK